MVVDDLVAEGDRVVARVTMSGTHRGEYAGMPGSGRAVRAEGIEIFRIARGKIAEGWSRFVLPLAMIEGAPDVLANGGTSAGRRSRPIGKSTEAARSGRCLQLLAG